MTPIEQPAPESEQHNVVEDDTTCLKCGYNLRTLRRGGACPECGAAVEESSPRKWHEFPQDVSTRLVVALFLKAVIPIWVVMLLTIATLLLVPLLYKDSTKNVVGVFVCAAVVLPPLLLLWSVGTVWTNRIGVGRAAAVRHGNRGERVAVRRDEAIDVIELSFLGLRVRGLNGQIHVPSEIEGYDEIRATLADWGPIVTGWRAGFRWFAGYAVAWVSLLALIVMLLGESRTSFFAGLNTLFGVVILSAVHNGLRARNKGWRVIGKVLTILVIAVLLNAAMWTLLSRFYSR